MLVVNLPLNQALLKFLLYMKQAWMTQLVLAISLWGLIFLLFQKDSVTHAWSCSLRELGLPFARYLSLENSIDSDLCFWQALLHLDSYFFFLYGSLSLSLSMIVHTISSNIDEVLSINPSANAFVFGDFYVHHKDRLTYSSGTDRPGEVKSSEMTFCRWSTFLFISLLWLLQSCSFGFNFSDNNIYSILAFTHLRNIDHVVVLVFIDFLSNSNG